MYIKNLFSKHIKNSPYKAEVALSRAYERIYRQIVARLNLKSRKSFPHE